MRLSLIAILAAFLLAALPASAHAQATFNLDWFTIDCGSATLEQDDFVLEGNLGQPDAHPEIAAEGYTLTGGFYSVPANFGCGSSDFNNDGDFGTDADIEAFFACLAGNCCPTCFPGGSDFNADGDYGTDADIEAFFRVLAGGTC